MSDVTKNGDLDIDLDFSTLFSDDNELNVDIDFNDEDIDMEFIPDGANDANNIGTPIFDTFEDLDFEEETIFDNETISTQDVETVFDYVRYLYAMQQIVERAETTLNNAGENNKVEFSLPITREDCELLDDVAYRIYYDFLNETVNSCINLDKPLPNYEDILTEFLDICEKANVFFGLYKDDFIASFKVQYSRVVNESTHYRNMLLKESNTVISIEDTNKIKETSTIINNIIKFPLLCEKILDGEFIKDFDMDIEEQIRSFNLDELAETNLHTVQDLILNLKSLLSSPEVLDFVLPSNRASSGDESSDLQQPEILRLLFLSDTELMNSYQDLKGIDSPDDIIGYLFNNLGTRMATNKFDVQAYILLSLGLLAFISDIQSKKIEDKPTLVAYMTSFRMMLLSAVEDPNCKTPAFILRYSHLNGKTCVSCSKGATDYQLDNDFYFIGGTPMYTIKTPLAVKCECPNKNCCGYLFPPIKFINKMLQWADNDKAKVDTSTRTSQHKSIRFKVNLLPLEINQLGLAVETDLHATTLKNMPREYEVWFLNFQKFIDNFTFFEDNVKPELITFKYNGSVSEDMIIPGYDVGKQVTIEVYGVERFGSQAHNEFKLASAKIESESRYDHITDGTITLDNNDMFITCFMNGNPIAQTIKISLDKNEYPTITEDASKVEVDLNDITCLPYDRDEDSKSYLKYRQIAYILSELNGLAFDFLEISARRILIAKYSKILRLPSIGDRIMHYILSSYTQWLKDETYKEDIINFTMLKAIFEYLQGKNNILTGIADGKDLSDDIKIRILDISSEKIDVSDIIEQYKEMNFDIMANAAVLDNHEVTANDEKLLSLYAEFPPIREYIMTLQYKIMIALICADDNTRFSAIFGQVSKLSKMYKKKEDLDLDTIKQSIVSKFKQYKNQDILTTAERLSNMQDSNEKDTNSMKLLTKFLQERNTFLLLSTLNKLSREDIVNSFISEMGLSDKITTDFFNDINNDDAFYELPYSVCIDDVYAKHFGIMKNYYEEGLLTLLMENNSRMSVIAYDIIIDIYDSLNLDFEEAPMLKIDCDGFNQLLFSLILSYCYVTGDAVFATNDGSNRVVAFKTAPEEFPLLYKLKPSVELTDFLYIS